jgi:hypothetical protein
MDVSESLALFSAIITLFGTLISFEALKLAGWSFFKKAD